MPWQVVVWIALIVVALAFQLQAVARGDHWGMLTSSTRWLRVRLWGRVILLPAFTWLTWHWFIEPPGMTRMFYDDLLAILVGLLLALVLDYDDLERGAKRHKAERD